MSSGSAACQFLGYLMPGDPERGWPTFTEICSGYELIIQERTTPAILEEILVHLNSQDTNEPTAIRLRDLRSIQLRDYVWFFLTLYFSSPEVRELIGRKDR